MKVEKSAGAIVFRKENNQIYYLLLHYPSGARSAKSYWEFPKGHVEGNEKLLDTAKREIQEETGIDDLKFIDGFKKTIKYFFQFKGEKILKFVTFFLAQTNRKKVKISKEHLGYEWLTFKEAMKRIKFENSKEVLRAANDFLKN